MQQNVLGLLYAQLELDYGYIRAVTPFYSIYDISSRSDAGWQKVLNDPSPAAVEIRTYWKAKGSGYQVSPSGCVEGLLTEPTRSTW